MPAGDWNRVLCVKHLDQGRCAKAGGLCEMNIAVSIFDHRSEICATTVDCNFNGMIGTRFAQFFRTVVVCPNSVLSAAAIAAGMTVSKEIKYANS